MKLLTVAAPVFIASILVSFAPTCQAAEQGWQWTVTPYLWTSSIDGTVEANGREADVDVDFGDILDNVDFGFPAHAEATKDGWSWALSPVYTSLSVDAEAVGQQGGQRDAEIESATTIIDSFGAYQFAPAWEVMAGIRYTRFDTEVEFKGPLVAGKSESDKNVFDGIAGLRYTHEIGDKWVLQGRADVGAGGSDLTWNGTALLGYRFVSENVLYAGYRALHYDFQDGDTLKFDATIAGPVFGFAFVF